jgi:hypothetical protein
MNEALREAPVARPAQLAEHGMTHPVSHATATTRWWWDAPWSPLATQCSPLSAKRVKRSGNADSRCYLFSSKIVTISNGGKRV